VETTQGKAQSITQKTIPAKFDERLTKIKEVQRGWLTYFRGTNITGKLGDIDGWLRNRVRYCIWHDWKKPDRKRKNHIRMVLTKTISMLGVGLEMLCIHEHQKSNNKK
jgi:hypothetical protein